MTPWETTALTVAKADRSQLSAWLGEADLGEQRELLRMRYRWRIDEFAEHVVRPMIERVTRWHPSNDFHHEVDTWPLLRSEDRGHTACRLMWAPRGSAKTTRAKIRVLHDILFDLDRCMLVMAAADRAAAGWVRTVRRWLAMPSPELAFLWPDIRVGGNEGILRVYIEGRSYAVHAQGWTGQVRGLNEETARPTKIVLDDIESEKTTSSEAVRDKYEDQLLSTVLPLLPQEGGGEVWWLATPVHHDCISARAFGGKPELRAWSLTRHRAVRRWPVRGELWDACKAVYFDCDTHETPEARLAAAVAFYAAHKAEMDEGADVLDPSRLPIFECYLRRWDLGETAWRREYDTDPKATSGRLFDPATWATYRWEREREVLVTKTGRRVRVADLKLTAHWDWSDGGDPGAIAVVGTEPSGRAFALDLVELDARATEQVKSVLDAVQRWRLREMQYEGANLSSLLEAELHREAVKRGVRVSIVPKTSTENKNRRISELEAPITNHLVVFDEKLPAVTKRRFEDFNPRRTDNKDDVPDALQRAVERGALPGVRMGQRPTR